MSQLETQSVPTRATATDRRRVHYVLSTHWDREWYQTFQDYRHRLVGLLDNVLDGIADGTLRGPFQTDGQAIILEDYLEVRPERREQIERFARESKLVIGPWYVLPDEFLVSGESIIRNIRLGRQIARDFGGTPSRAGFACDLFGHVSQLPQIFAGFGIAGGFIWRGVNLPDKRHVRWIGADGTELPCYRFGRTGYCTYAFHVRRAPEPDYTHDPEKQKRFLREMIDEEAAASEVDAVLLFDGGDHLEWDPQDYRGLLAYGRSLEKDGDASFELVHSSLDGYLEDMLEQAGRVSTVVAGELREPGRHPAIEDFQWVIPGVLSSRVWIKQANAACESLLCQWAEPLAAWASDLLGREYPQGFLDVAWKWLLKNHPHDSICACSIDQVHEDMKFRFSQCRQIAERQSREAMLSVAAAIEGEVSEDELRVVVFNPLSRPLEQTAELVLEIPAEWPCFNEFFGFEPKPAFRIYDAEGNEVPYQRLAQRPGRHRFRTWPHRFPQGWAVTEVTVSVPLSIAAMGYTTLTVRRGEMTPDDPIYRSAPLWTRHPDRPGLATSERAMENESLRVEVESNGTITLTDKRSGERYERLLTFEDTADIGDGWYHGQAQNDQTFVSTASAADVALVHDGPMAATFRVRTTMRVPRRVERPELRRSDDFAELTIDSYLTLRPGQPRVEVETIVDNTAEDHRLRVLLPSGAAGAKTYLADTPFDVVERPITLREDNHLYRELEVETKPQQSFTAVHDGSRGLAVVSRGLYESAVRDLPERPIALTLLRGTRKTVFTDGEPGGQVLGRHAFHYWLVPLAEAPDVTELLRLGQQIAGGLRVVQLRPKDVERHRGERADLPPAAGWFELDGRAILTSARRVGDDAELRLFNPTESEQAVELRFAHVPQGARLVNFESEPIEGAVELRDETLRLTLEPKQIRTVSLRFG